MAGALIVRNREGLALAWNEAAEKLYGWPAVDALGKDADALLRSDPVFWPQLLDEERNSIFEITRATEDRQAIRVRAEFTGFYDPDGTMSYSVEVAREIAAKPAAESGATIVDGPHERDETLLALEALELENAALKRRLQNHRALFQHMPIALCRVNSDALHDRLRGLGLPRKPAIAAYLASHHEVVRSIGEACFIEEANAQAAALLGASSPEDLAGRPIGFAWRSRPDTFAQVLAAGILRSSCELETQLDTLQGGIVNVLFASAVLSDGGERRSMVGMININDRLAAQEAYDRLHAEFAHASRLSLLGELAASISHEISQPLSAIATTGTTGLRWLDQAEPRVERARRSLEQIVAYAQRASGIIARVREMASGRTPVMSDVSLNAIMGSALQLVQAQARSARIEISATFAEAHDIVHVDRTQIEQVIVNLLINAFQAIASAPPSARRVEVGIRDDVDHVECTVSDSGPGIAADRLNEVFERFVSSKAEGTGLGLALCRSIVSAHGGSMVAQNGSPLGGALFRFRLPAASYGTG